MDSLHYFIINIMMMKKKKKDFNQYAGSAFAVRSSPLYWSTRVNSSLPLQLAIIIADVSHSYNLIMYRNEQVNDRALEYTNIYIDKFTCTAEQCNVGFCIQHVTRSRRDGDVWTPAQICYYIASFKLIFLDLLFRILNVNCLKTGRL